MRFPRMTLCCRDNRHVLALFFYLIGGASLAYTDDVIFGNFTWPDCGVRFEGCSDNADSAAHIRSLAMHSDGKLYAGGLFYYVGDDMPTSCIAAWDGTSWTALNSTPGGNVRAVLSANDSIYVGGFFTAMSGVPTSRIARWDGKNWHPLGLGTNGAVHALAATQENGLPVLYAAGAFMGAGGQSARRIARWDGAKWSSLGPGASSLDNTALGLAIFDDGAGPAVYVCGVFEHAGGKPAGKVAKWDINTGIWSSLGQGITDSNGYANTLAVFDDGNGPALYMGGDFLEVDGQPIQSLAKWDGKQWSPVGQPPMIYVETLRTLNDGNTTALYAGGAIIGAFRFAKWDGQTWTRYEPIEGSVISMEYYDSGDGLQLHIGGGEAEFETKIARFERGFACGDFNQDGVVDQQDLGILLSSYDCTGPGCQGDADGDGDTDQADLGILLKFYGQKCG